MEASKKNIFTQCTIFRRAILSLNIVHFAYSRGWVIFQIKEKSAIEARMGTPLAFQHRQLGRDGGIKTATQGKNSKIATQLATVERRISPRSLHT
jgi:hypothetical protein